jgi:hypothetical protein
MKALAASIKMNYANTKNETLKGEGIRIGLSAVPMNGNIDHNVVQDFGEEWSRFDQSDLRAKELAYGS